MSKCRCLICDFDGTVASSDRTISKGNLKAIKGFIERGGIFVLCTGRMTPSIEKILRSNNLDCLLASFNGAVLTNLKTGEVLYSHKIDNKTVIKAFTLFNKLNLNAHCYDNETFIAQENSKTLETYTMLNGVQPKVVKSILNHVIETGLDSGKLLVFEDKEVCDKHFEEVKNTLSELEVVRSNDHHIDINVLGKNKGFACEFISKYFNIPLSEIIGVGDNGNDEPMFKKVGLPIVMGNGLDSLKAKYKTVAPDNDSDAIKYVIENYCI